MANGSEEGNEQGLGWVNAKVVKFKFDNNQIKIPHMGWNNIIMKKQNTLFKDMYDEPRFYFVHSYYLECADEKDISLTCRYGNEFVCGIEKENIFGVQFHPEKSHKFGMKLLQNFCACTPKC